MANTECGQDARQCARNRAVQMRWGQCGQRVVSVLPGTVARGGGFRLLFLGRFRHDYIDSALKHPVNQAR